MSAILLRWSLWASVFQLVGTALIVWGLRIKKSAGPTPCRTSGSPCSGSAGLGT